MADFTNAKAADALRTLAHEIETGRAQVDGIVMVIASPQGCRSITIGDEYAAGYALGLAISSARTELAQFVAMSSPAASPAVN